MSDIAKWLLAQYDADEARQRSRRSIPDVDGRGCPRCGWRIDGLVFADRVAPGAFELLPCRCVLERAEMEEFAPTECRADPAVLADLAAKRRIVELFLGDTPLTPEHASADDYYWWALIDVMRLLASALSDREGYDPSWAVES